MFTLLVKRAAELANAPAGSLEEEEFDVLSNAIEAYEAKRWPEGLRKKSSRDCGKKKSPLGSLRRAAHHSFDLISRAQI